MRSPLLDRDRSGWWQAGLFITAIAIFFLGVWAGYRQAESDLQHLIEAKQ